MTHKMHVKRKLSSYEESKQYRDLFCAMRINGMTYKSIIR